MGERILAILIGDKFIKSLLEGKEAEPLDQRFSNLSAQWDCLGVNGHIIPHPINQIVWGVECRHCYFKNNISLGDSNIQPRLKISMLD